MALVDEGTFSFSTPIDQGDLADSNGVRHRCTIKAEEHVHFESLHKTQAPRRAGDNEWRCSGSIDVCQVLCSCTEKLLPRRAAVVERESVQIAWRGRLAGKEIANNKQQQRQTHG